MATPDVKLELLHEVLRRTAQQPGVDAALLLTFEGDPLVAEPCLSGTKHLPTEWAREQAAVAASYRRNLHQREFSVVVEEAADPAPCHFYVRQVSDYLLALLFKEPQNLGDIRRLSRSVVVGVERLLVDRR